MWMLESFGKKSKSRRILNRSKTRSTARGGRTLKLEPLEDRRLLAVFSHVFADINPDQSDLDPTDPDGASGGRVGGLATVAGDNATYYAASEYGGVYKSADFGLTWDHLDGHLPQITWDVEVDPSDSDRVYATSFYDARVDPVTGIQVSNDAGATWTAPPTARADQALEGTANDNTPQATYTSTAARRTEPAAYGIAVRPDASNNVAVGTNAGLAISNDSGVTWQIIDPHGQLILSHLFSDRAVTRMRFNHGTHRILVYEGNILRHDEPLVVGEDPVDVEVTP